VLPANRGRILDRHGLILASSVPASSVWAIPEDVERNPAQLNRLARLLGLSLADLNQRLSNEDKTFVWLKRQVDDAAAKEVEALDLKGVYLRKEYRRQYPEGEAAAHVVGFTNVEDVGQEGVELAFNKVLTGRNGMRRVIKDRLGRVVEAVGDTVQPLDGTDLQLSIDSKVQFFAYQKLQEAVTLNRAQAGSVVVLDALTGEVLALANYPSYWPMNRQTLSGQQLRNRALTDTFEPGSVMKPFTIGLALETGRVTPKTLIDTNHGKFSITGVTISDVHPNGVLTVEGVLQKSSNIGTAKIAMQLPARGMWELYTQVGFGQKPQVNFPGAVSGKLRPYETWRPIEQATMSYGYGLSASLFQMTQAYTVFSHDGEIIPVTLLKTDLPAQGVRVFSKQTASQVRHMLHLAAGSGGTAAKAQTIGYSVGGKSGTSYMQVGGGYGSEQNRKYRSWFVGMAPIENPRIVVGVMLDQPSAGQYFGGAVAAPVFSAVVQQTLRMMDVAPDLSVKPQIVAAAPQEDV
jgi:cell division protein FtsI (penicillin-binding protein 3)